MTDNTSPSSPDSDAEIRRVCTLLESIARQYADDSPETHALADAALAYQVVQQHEALRRSFEHLRAAGAAPLTEEMLARLQPFGINPNA